jgi:hypothetical protein
LLLVPRCQRLFHFGPLVGRNQRYELALPLVQFDARPGILRAVEHAVQAVVVARRDGIEFVVVTASTAQRHAQERSAEIVNRVFDGQVLWIVVDARTEATRVGDVAGSDDPLIPFFVGRAAAQVAGKLVAHKFVVRQVALEGVDHPVAIAVNLRNRIVRVVAGRVRVTDHVQPVPAPPFAVAGRIEQTIDDAGEGLIRSIGQKRGDFLGRRRQAGQIIGRSANQSPLVRVSGGRKFQLFAPSQNKSVDVVSRPVGVPDGRRRRIGDGSQRPELARRRNVDLLADVFAGRRSRIGSANLDPSFQIGDFGIG